MDEFFEVAEVAKTLRLTPRYVRHLLRDGTLKGIKVGHRAWRIPKTALLAHITRTAVKARD